jgi:hypothetical protein
MIGGHWPATQEVFHLTIIALTSSPLLLSWDIRDSSSSTLPLSAYLNPELVAVHQDLGELGKPYYSRLVGGELSRSAVRVNTAQDCVAVNPAVVWQLNQIIAPGMSHDYPHIMRISSCVQALAHSPPLIYLDGV